MNDFLIWLACVLQKLKVTKLLSYLYFDETPLADMLPVPRTALVRQL